MFGVRVRLDPVLASGGGRRRTRGVRLSLTGLGAASKNVTRDPQPAMLVFHAVGFDRIRTENVRREAKVGSIEGTIRFASANTPVFDVKAPLEEALVLEAPLEPLPQGAHGSDTPSKTRRALELHFESRSFEHVSNDQLLLLPDEVIDGCAYLELYAELEVGGAKEAERTANDVLDTPITADAPIPLVPKEFRVQVTDHAGNPLGNEAYELDLDGVVVSGTTDGDGHTLFHRTRTTAGKLRVAGFEYEVHFVEEPSDDVREFQAILNALGFRAGELTGSINRPTEDAILAFQRKHGLRTTGELDAATKRTLRERFVADDLENQKGAA